jgi:hypothetical protein
MKQCNDTTMMNKPPWRLRGTPQISINFRIQNPAFWTLGVENKPSKIKMVPNGI